jgi:hypothetical protein
MPSTISPPRHVLTIKVAGISFLIHADKLNAHDKMEFAYVHFADDGSIPTDIRSSKVRRIRRRRGHKSYFHELMKLHGPFHTGNPHVDMIADFHRQDNLKRDMNASRVVKSTSTNM